MTIALSQVRVKHERRIQLYFTVSLAAGAFQSTTFYTVTSVDGAGASPGVQAAYMVTGSPGVVELQLDEDLVGGAVYAVSAVGVPGSDATTTPDPSSVNITLARETASVTTANAASDMDRLLFGYNILWSDGEFVEDQTGDLATVFGAACLRATVENLLVLEGLPWAPDRGLQPREYIDGARAPLVQLRGRAERELRRDDRIARVRATIVDLESNTEEASLRLTVQPIAGGVFSLQVPVG